MRHKFVPLNTVVISGHLTHDPELKFTKDGTPCLDFQMGFTARFSGKEKHGFIQIACFGELAQTVQRLRKGLPVIVEGELRDQVLRSKAGQWYHRPKILAQHVWRQTEDDLEDVLDVVCPAEERA